MALPRLLFCLFPSPFPSSVGLKWRAHCRPGIGCRRGCGRQEPARGPESVAGAPHRSARRSCGPRRGVCGMRWSKEGGSSPPPAIQVSFFLFRSPLFLLISNPQSRRGASRSCLGRSSTSRASGPRPSCGAHARTLSQPWTGWDRPPRAPARTPRWPARSRRPRGSPRCALSCSPLLFSLILLFFWGGPGSSLAIMPALAVF